MNVLFLLGKDNFPKEGMVSKPYFRAQRGVMSTAESSWRSATSGVHLNTKKNFSTVRVTKPCNRLPREVVEPFSLQIVKTCLDTILCKLLWVNLL